MNKPASVFPDKPFREMNPEEVFHAVQTYKALYQDEIDLKFLRNLNEEVVGPLRTYFRPKFVGFEEMPERNRPEAPLIFACNHSGMAFPWDAIILYAMMLDRFDYDFSKLFRPLAAPALSASILMNPFMIPGLWKRAGAIDATSINFEMMMNQEDTNVLVYPEGVPGIGKGFNRKYQLQKFSTSMIRMSIKYRTDIVWISCINGEYINPYSYASKWLNRQVSKVGIPYLPMAPHTLLLLLQPWIFYYAMPAKLTYVRGNRYKPYEMVGNRPLEEVSIEEIKQIRDEIQASMQAELSHHHQVYGKHPYRMGEFLRTARKNWRDLPYWTPIGWPALFIEYDRLYRKEDEPPKGIIRGWFRFWKIVRKNPIVLAFFLPLIGWVPILYKGLKGRKTVKQWLGSKV
ncbi:hypothetical protein [Pontibacter sp. G13]|uniref:hypothetical protein n=1 Tax=Pontibacter sp. G13 TaxID=3074898 RepID=UPI002889D9E1|nr:hypothetical protein [Pontibacter sp. G13]WNJ19456.1 hypothetical protein RJD25_03095 [Pontibacter sp. G13]